MVPIRYAVHAVFRRCIKAQQLSGVCPIKGIAGAGQGGCTQRTGVGTVHHVIQPAYVTQCHFHIGTQVMGKGDRLGFLHMGKAGHKCINMRIHGVHQYMNPVDECRTNFLCFI